MHERTGLPTPIPDFWALHPKRLTRAELRLLMAVGPHGTPTADAAASIGSARFGTVGDTPFHAAEVEAEEERFAKDRAKHLDRLRTYEDDELMDYLAEAAARSLTSWFHAEWRVPWQEGMAPEGSGLFNMIVDLAIPNQGSRRLGGGAVMLHLTEELDVRDAVLWIGDGDPRLRALGPERGAALINVALHRGMGTFGPGYREDLLEAVAAALAERDAGGR